MDVHIEEEMISEYVNKIQALAVLALYGQNVDSPIKSVVSEACYFLLRQRSDATANLLAFKSRLTKMGNDAHYSLPEYKKPFEYAASLVAIH
ncbi:hypothetical protein V8G57_22790 [Collimonas sp. H4R21]|jgi:hypothetical protein|uniref:Uncharacterized protein n=1 Tax=Collimonas rhizosphaerae TaxID=3126357 RepID=A0ABU9Q1U9_9BURK|nr:hypothetical protein [Collimonas sp. OK412]SFD25425.1 hypothetical protein SAMN04515619_13339 [Collimonas sp. OK412]